LAKLEQHKLDCMRWLGVDFENVHRWLDEFMRTAGPQHDKSSLLVKCAQLLVNDAAFKRRTGHNGLNCPDDAETIDTLVFGLGLDLKTRIDRGLLLVRFT